MSRAKDEEDFLKVPVVPQIPPVERIAPVIDPVVYGRMIEILHACGECCHEYPGKAARELLAELSRPTFILQTGLP